MKIDVSEVKTFKNCRRQWLFTSRNRYHLRAKAPLSALHTGTLFHEALHALYLGSELNKVMEWVRREMINDGDTCLLAMIPGYYKNVLEADLERFQVLDIEHKFEIQPLEGVDIQICGSIDMIVLEKATNKIFGFEHKTAKNFRDTSFLWMDEQPRVYTVALQQYVDQLNAKQYEEWTAAGASAEAKPTPYRLGGIYINEVKKLLRDFKYQRTLCTYPEEDLQNFFEKFLGTCCAIQHVATSSEDVTPTPSYFSCSICAFRGVCETYMYRNVSKDEILKEFSEEFEERDIDHLDEKVERVKE